MISDSLFTTALYFIISAGSFLLFLSVSRRISGPKLNYTKLFAYLVPLAIWIANQLCIARYGYMLLDLPPKYFFENNFAIRWIALASSLLHCTCLPSIEGGLKEQVQQSVNFSEHANHETGHSRLRNIVTTWRLNEPSLPD